MNELINIVIALFRITTTLPIEPNKSIGKGLVRLFQLLAGYCKLYAQRLNFDRIR